MRSECTALFNKRVYSTFLITPSKETGQQRKYSRHDRQSHPGIKLHRYCEELLSDDDSLDEGGYGAGGEIMTGGI